MKLNAKNVKIMIDFSATDRANDLITEFYKNMDIADNSIGNRRKCRNMEIMFKFLCNVLFCLDHVRIMLFFLCSVSLLSLLLRIFNMF